MVGSAGEWTDDPLSTAGNLVVVKAAMHALGMEYEKFAAWVHEAPEEEVRRRLLEEDEVRAFRQTLERDLGKLPDMAQLEEWRRAGSLIMSEEDLRVALFLEESDPGQLRSLIRAVQRILDEHEPGSNEAIQLTAKVESVEPGDAAEPAPPRRRLELITTFDQGTSPA